MFGPFDGNVMENGCQQMGQSYSTGSFASNVSQTNFFSSLLTDFVTETDYNYNSYQSYVYTDSGQNAQTFDSSEASSPPPTPDIISSFAAFAAESPLSSSTTTTTATVETTPTYQNLCSPLQTYNCPLQSPTSSCSSLSMASPSFTYDETKKQLIKDSLRLTIQSRRSAQGLDLMDACDMSSTTNTESDNTSTPDICLTEADSERRRRRRERNKVAATKCRNKKKLHSIKLHQVFKHTFPFDLSFFSFKPKLLNRSQSFTEKNL